MTNPQNLNQYSYVMNNPLRYTDPTGHSLIENQYGGGCSTSGYCPGTSNNNNENNNNHNNDDADEDDSSNEDGGDILDKDKNDTGDELTNVQLIGQAFTYGLIEITILLPIDIALAETTVAGVGACLDGVLIMCVADIPIGALDVVVADFQISLGNTIVQNVATGTQHEFEWIIIPKILSAFAE